MDNIFPMVRPDVPKLDQWEKYLGDIYNSNHFSNGGNVWKTLNRRLEILFPARKVVSIANNTVGQISVLDALQARGKKVLVSNFTFPATLQAVIHSGGIPVICDVNAESGEISVHNVEEAIKEHGRIDFVLYTRIFGQRLDMTNLETFLASKNIPLVIDAAAGLPTNPIEYSDSIEVFSFHATKAFSVGEAGAIVGPEAKIKKIWEACNFGFQGASVFSDGINSKMDEFTAARAIAMLENFEDISKKRQEFVKKVYSGLEDHVELSTISNDGSWAWSLYPIKFKNTRDLEMFSEITQNSGLTGKKYYSPSMLTGYKGTAEILYVSNLKNSEIWANNTYCLPVYAQYSGEDIQKIQEIVNTAILNIGCGQHKNS